MRGGNKGEPGGEGAGGKEGQMGRGRQRDAGKAGEGGESTCQAPGYGRNGFTASGSLAKSGKIRETPGRRAANRLVPPRLCRDRTGT